MLAVPHVLACLIWKRRGTKAVDSYGTRAKIVSAKRVQQNNCIGWAGTQLKGLRTWSSCIPNSKQAQV